ncbi:MAG TPA: CoA ester lyase [Chloroflexota bacterium]|nr:CoA ester lyase [Chloroflexota bacterium]
MLRSLLFVPGNQPRMLDKARSVSADAVVLDLEDGVPAGAKDEARRLVSAAAASSFAARVIVRLNGLEAGSLAADVAAALSAGATAVLLPKVERAADVQELAAHLPREVRIIPSVETARGVLHAEDIALADPRVEALAFGPEDFARDLAVERSKDGAERMQALGLMVLAARSAGVLPLDGPWGDFAELDGLAAECERVRHIGIKGKFAIHPAQLDIINRAFAPNEAELDWARRAVERYEAAAKEGRGAVALDGQMIDEPVYRRAQDLLRS